MVYLIVIYRQNNPADNFVIMQDTDNKSKTALAGKILTYRTYLFSVQTIKYPGN